MTPRKPFKKGLTLNFDFYKGEADTAGLRYPPDINRAIWDFFMSFLLLLGRSITDGAAVIDIENVAS